MILKVYTGKDCPKCPPAKQLCQDVAGQLGLDYQEINIEENMIEALQLQIASTPSIVLDDEVVFRSDVPERQALVDEINKRR